MTKDEKSANLTREISYARGGDVPQHRITIDQGAFGPNAIQVREAARRTDKKLNLRIRQEDNLLLKALAAHAEVNISALLNRLLHDLLLDALLEIEEDDARALLARAADARASYDVFEQPWCMDVGRHFADRAIENAVQWNDLAVDAHRDDELRHGVAMAEIHSELFNELDRLLKEMK